MQISVWASLEPGHNLAPPNPKKGNLVPASCHAHPVSIIIIFKKKKEGKKKLLSKKFGFNHNIQQLHNLILSSSFNEAY
jgi:hypothetical protein